MKRLAFAIALLTAGVGSVAAEQFYKWKDANGVWRYTSEPPPAGTDASKVLVSGGPRRNTAAAEAGAADAAGTPGTGASAPPTENTAKAIADRRAAACETARKRYEVLSKNAAVEWDRDGDGTAERLDPIEQAVEVEKAQQDMGIYCKKS